MINFDFDPMKAKTSKKCGGKMCQWNEYFIFGGHFPSLCQTFVFRVMVPECCNWIPLSTVEINFADKYFGLDGTCHLSCYTSFPFSYRFFVAVRLQKIHQTLGPATFIFIQHLIALSTLEACWCKYTARSLKAKSPKYCLQVGLEELLRATTGQRSISLAIWLSWALMRLMLKVQRWKLK